MAVEQAIYTSAQTATREGYQLVATSPGIEDVDARALSAWCPSHDALREGAPHARSMNFSRLPSGAFAVSRTMAAGDEYSRRGGDRLFTRILIVTAEDLLRFSNDPLAVYRAAEAGGRMHATGDDEPLSAFPLVGRSRPVNEDAILRLIREIGAARLAALIDAAIASPALGVLSTTSAELVVTGLVQCLPIECRPEFSFTTGLRHSPRRPFRVVALDHDAEELRRVQRQSDAIIVDMDQKPDAFAFAQRGWGYLVAHALALGGVQGLASVLTQPRPGLSLRELPELAAALVERVSDGFDSASAEEPSDDGAFGRYRPSPGARQAAETVGLAAAPSATKTVELLETLDDAVFDSVAGKPGAIDVLRRLWPQLREALDEEAIEESRECYLKHALGVWTAFAKYGRDPERAVNALDVLCHLLAD